MYSQAIVKIIFTNGSIITAEQNGTCFITDAKPDFPDDLSTVIVTGDDPLPNYTYHNTEIIECASIDGRYWFAFHELTPDELYRKQLDDERSMMLDLIAEQEYQLCLIDLGLN